MNEWEPVLWKWHFAILIFWNRKGTLTEFRWQLVTWNGKRNRNTSSSRIKTSIMQTRCFSFKIEFKRKRNIFVVTYLLDTESSTTWILCCRGLQCQCLVWSEVAVFWQNWKFVNLRANITNHKGYPEEHYKEGKYTTSKLIAPQRPKLCRE